MAPAAGGSPEFANGFGFRCVGVWGFRGLGFRGLGLRDRGLGLSFNPQTLGPKT